MSRVTLKPSRDGNSTARLTPKISASCVMLSAACFRPAAEVFFTARFRVFSRCSFWKFSVWASSAPSASFALFSRVRAATTLSLEPADMVT